MAFEVVFEDIFRFSHCKRQISKIFKIDESSIFSPFEEVPNQEIRCHFMVLDVIDLQGNFLTLVNLEIYGNDTPQDLFPHGPALALAFDCRVAMAGAYPNPEYYVVFDPSGEEFVGQDLNEEVFDLKILYGPFEPQTWKLMQT